MRDRQPFVLFDLSYAQNILLFPLLFLLFIWRHFSFTSFQMYDMSEEYLKIKGAILRSIDDVEMESLDTSTSTEGESTTPTQSSPLPMNTSDFENTIYELIDKQRCVIQSFKIF